MAKVGGDVLGTEICEALGFTDEEIGNITEVSIVCEASEPAFVKVTFLIPDESRQPLSKVLKQYEVHERVSVG